MRSKLFTLVATLALAPLAHAATYNFSFTGPSVSGSVDMTYGTATDARYPQAIEITGASGTFSDANLGISNTAITGLVPITHSTPASDNHLAPADFSRFPVATGTQYGFLSFSNLFYPDGSPQTATTYPFHGGIFDIYGLLLTIGGGRVVDIWSNGVLPMTTFPDYAVAVATSASSLDYVSGGVTPTPEPGTLCLLASGTLGAAVQLRRRLRPSR